MGKRRLQSRFCPRCVVGRIARQANRHAWRCAQCGYETLGSPFPKPSAAFDPTKPVFPPVSPYLPDAALKQIASGRAPTEDETKRMASELINKRALGSSAMRAFLGGLGAGFGGALRQVADEALWKRVVPAVDVDALEELAKAGGGKTVPVDADVLQKIVDELRMRRKAVPT